MNKINLLTCDCSAPCYCIANAGSPNSLSFYASDANISDCYADCYSHAIGDCGDWQDFGSSVDLFILANFPSIQTFISLN